MKGKIIILFIIILLGRILFLSFCKNPEEINFKNKFYLTELTHNSNLPIPLMEKVDFTEQENEDFSIYTAYSDTMFYDRYTPYPADDPNNMYIILIFIDSDSYNVLGLSIGDNLEEIEKTMKQYGYMRDIFRLPYISYKKGDIHIRFDISSDNHIEKIRISYFHLSPYDLLVVC